jgi:uncharacterized membrane protein YkoI
LSAPTEGELETYMQKLITAAALLIATSASPVAAQEVVYAPSPPVSAAEAQDIAASTGIVAIRKMELDDEDGQWEIKGRAADGARVEVEIDRRTGAIVQVERYY